MSDSKSKTPKTAVVTGGAGFIGSYLSEELLKQGFRLIIIDDLSTGKTENIQHLSGNVNLRFVKGSILDLHLLQGLFSGADYIFHQAAIASVPESIHNPISSHEANLTGTLNVLLAARDNRVKKVIFASSSAVYGENGTSPKLEDMTPDPKSPYAVTKLASEYYCQNFYSLYGISTACLRYFNVFGPRQDPDSQYSAVIPKFIKRISEGSSPIIFGDGEQTRDFIFVKDVARANILAAQSEFTGILNIGRGESISLNHLTQLLLGLMDRYDLEPVFEKERQGDLRNSLADVSKCTAIGFIPKYQLREGLFETIKASGFYNNSISVADPGKSYSL